MLDATGLHHQPTLVDLRPVCLETAGYGCSLSEEGMKFVDFNGHHVSSATTVGSHILQVVTQIIFTYSEPSAPFSTCYYPIDSC